VRGFCFRYTVFSLLRRLSYQRFLNKRGCGSLIKVISYRDFRVVVNIAILKSSRIEIRTKNRACNVTTIAGLDMGNANPFSDVAPNLNFLALSEIQINTKILNYVFLDENCCPLFACFQECQQIILFDRSIKVEKKGCIAVS
jgi:hypothetical protein